MFNKNRGEEDGNANFHLVISSGWEFRLCGNRLINRTRYRYARHVKEGENCDLSGVRYNAGKQLAVNYVTWPL